MKAAPFFAFAAFSLLLASAPAAAEEDYVRKELYPAEVLSFAYFSQVVDADHPLKVGYWTVGFGESLPKAIYHEDADGSNAQVEIQDLVCTDEGLGAFSCGLSLPSEGACLLFVDIPPETFVDQSGDDWAMIACPTSLNLAG